MPLPTGEGTAMRMSSSRHRQAVREAHNRTAYAVPRAAQHKQSSRAFTYPDHVRARERRGPVWDPGGEPVITRAQKVAEHSKINVMRAGGLRALDRRVLVSAVPATNGV